ncbi:MAG: hypothetical protein J3K34DRAFT_404318 [Monoraphidium minutum]|nr:MAG: hypothetical protein J3K34DRAFT_404318 [Monoraphidium minutum]
MRVFTHGACAFMTCCFACALHTGLGASPVICSDLLKLSAASALKPAQRIAPAAPSSRIARHVWCLSAAPHAR